MITSLLSNYVQKTDDGYVYAELWTKYASALLSKVFLYAALFIAIVTIVCAVFIRKKKPEAFSAFLKTAACVAVTFALTVILTMLTIGFAKISEKGYMQEKRMLLVLVPPMAAVAIAIVGAIASYAAALRSKKAKKIALIVTATALGVAIVACLVCLGVYFNANVKNDGYYDTADGSYGKVDQLALYLSTAAIILVAIATAAFSDKKGNPAFDSKAISLAGVCVALSYALSYIKLWDMPNGGSITLVSLLPVMLYAYLFGMKKGLFVGFIYGLLQSLQDPYIIHPAQFLLDYPVAFSAVGFAGALSATKLPDRVSFALSALIAGTVRFVSHVLSGVFAFSSYAIDAGASSALAYSAAYNSCILIDAALVVIAGVLLLSSKAFAAEIKKFRKIERVQRAEKQETIG